jgi:uncharacterized protein (DUF1810 family)
VDDPLNLQRFVDAQTPVIDRVRAELRAGRKRSHWMWFVFPQIAGLGGSPMAKAYAISSLAEARAYLAHPVLGPRLRECVELVNAIEGRTMQEIFGTPDDLKFRSCVTLFARVSGGESMFADSIEKYFGGMGDDSTARLLAATPADL